MLRTRFCEGAGRKRIGLVLVMAATGVAGAQKVCDVHAYGAKGDGVAKDTVAIQKAIDDCSAKKGTVKLAAGRFVSVPLVLKSGITFSV